MNMNDSGPYEYNDAMAIANAFRAANVSNILPKVMCVCVFDVSCDPECCCDGLDWTGLDWTGLDWTGIE
jgi:hypothetical protein